MLSVPVRVLLSSITHLHLKEHATDETLVHNCIATKEFKEGT